MMDEPGERRKIWDKFSRIIENVKCSNSAAAAAACIIQVVRSLEKQRTDDEFGFRNSKEAFSCLIHTYTCVAYTFGEKCRIF